MAERRTVSLLDSRSPPASRSCRCCSASSLLVAVVRPADPDAAWRQGRNDRYVSVRHVAALKTFERAIVARGTAGASAIDARQVLAASPRAAREWGVRTGALPWLRRTVLGGAAAPRRRRDRGAA